MVVGSAVHLEEHGTVAQQAMEADLNKQIVVVGSCGGSKSFICNVSPVEVRQKPGRPPKDDAKRKCQFSSVMTRPSTRAL